MMLKKNLYIWGPVVSLVFIVFLLSSFSTHLADDPVKIVPILGYFLLGFFFIRAMLLIKPYSKIFCLTISFTLSFLIIFFDQFYQGLSFFQQSAWKNGLIDLAGMALGIGTYFLLYYSLMGSKKIYPQAKAPEGCCSLETNIP